MGRFLLDFWFLPYGNYSFLEQKMTTTQKVRLKPKTNASSGAVKRLLKVPADFRIFPYPGLPLTIREFHPLFSITIQKIVVMYYLVHLYTDYHFLDRLQAIKRFWTDLFLSKFHFTSTSGSLYILNFRIGLRYNGLRDSRCARTCMQCEIQRTWKPSRSTLTLIPEQ